MERRRFLANTPVGTFAPLLPELPEPMHAEYALLRVSRRAMATKFEIAIPYGTPNALAAASDALDLIDDLEDQLTIYRDSELMQINETASDGWVAVEPKLFQLLQTCAMYSLETGGAFDAATGALTEAWGFQRRQGSVPSPFQRAEAMAKTGMRHVMLNAETRSIKYRQPGLKLNLGSIGKGYALDCAAEMLQTRWGIRSALLHGGGSSVRAIGVPPDDTRGWPIAIRHPWDTARTLGTVRLNGCGFATSAATFQYFEYNGKKLGHVLDPRTGWPADGTASASVVAQTAAEADAYSTAYFVLGAASHNGTKPHLGSVILNDCDMLEIDLPGDVYTPATFRERYLNDLSFPD